MNSCKSRSGFVVAMAGGMMALASIGVNAQSFPTKLIRVVNPAAPGGNSDVFFRLLQPKMTEFLGQQLVFDYRAGGGGMIGSEAVARADADGYTVGIVNLPGYFFVPMYRKASYSTKYLALVARVVSDPTVMVTRTWNFEPSWRPS